MHEVIMPKLGLTMESGVIEKWHKKEGDKVEEGDVLFEVMTDKVSLEVEAYSSGILKKMLKKEGDDVPVTEVVAYIGGEDEQIPEVKTPIKDKQIETGEKDKEAKEPSEPVISGKKERMKISPLARRTAKKKDIDISKIIGTGPGGRIVEDDVVKYAESITEQAFVKIKEEPVAEVPGKITIKSSAPLKGIRKIIAGRMSLSKSTIPHLVQNVAADATDLVKLRERLKEKILSIYNVKVTYTDFLLKICGIALRENIEINASLQNDNYIIYDDINIGLAVSVKEGLIVPTVFKCDRLGILDIVRKRTELVEKAKKGTLQLNEVVNGTFTITNLGMFGIRSSTAIINPPQAAILAVGEIYEAPAVVSGKIEVRSFVELSVSCDHRIIDGAEAAKFMQRITELVENPEILII